MCPACARRLTMLVEDDCPICGGTGVLALGAAGLARHPAEVASRAIEIALEGIAKESLAAAGPDMTVARRHLTRGVGELTKAGLIAKTPQPEPLHLAARLSTEDIKTEARRMNRKHPADDAVLDAPALAWEPDDRPLAAGGIPGFSAAGYIANLARVCDPLDPLARTTRDHAVSVIHTERHAKVLAAAAVHTGRGGKQ
ncbi:hypothetical protein D1871_11010 [Nakamurella silvestris]|nr:hypothetical protein D1871_11010 [Nakamurella silvestris]